MWPVGGKRDAVWEGKKIWISLKPPSIKDRESIAGRDGFGGGGAMGVEGGGAVFGTHQSPTLIWCEVFVSAGPWPPRFTATSQHFNAGRGLVWTGR